MVPARRVDRNASGLIDDKQIIRLVDYADVVACDGRFVAMEGMRDNFAVFEDSVGSGGFAVHSDVATFKGFSLLKENNTM